MNKLESLIRQHCILPATPVSSGFYPTLCKICNDSGKKGPRAGFKFDENETVYNCFNCGHSAHHDGAETFAISHKMETVLTSIGIAQIDWERALFDVNLAGQHGKGGDRKELESLIPPTVKLPSYFYRMTNNQDDDMAQIAIDYLEKRKINWQSYPFYLTKHTSQPEAKRWLGRLIVPIFYRDDPIMWFGRDVVDGHLKKYLLADIPKATVLYGFDEVERRTSDPLYVVEGWFDAFAIKGVAIFGNKMTQQQERILTNSPRPKVVIPDRRGDGRMLANRAIQLGWNVSTPDIGSCKDVNEAIIRYGFLYTMSSIVENTHNSQARVNMYCDKPTLKRNQDNHGR